MTPFGEFPGLTLYDLARTAIWEAIDEAGIDPRALGIAYLGNCYAGMLQGQDSGRAVTILRNAGLGGMGMIHVESGSASSSLAFHDAWLAVGSGVYDVALAVGVEKLHVPGDPARSIAAISTSGERFVAGEMGLTWMGELWMGLERIMDRYGWTREDFARVAAKNTRNASLNPRAQVRTALSTEEILQARTIAGEITRPMCAAASVDGAAAAILCSDEVARRLSRGAVRVASCAVSGARWFDEDEAARVPGLLSMDMAPEVFAAAYERAGIGPEDVELVQCHDAIAAEELVAYEVMGFCGPGEGAGLVADGRTAIEGDLPTNTDGGLVGRGHPIGATGLAQVCEAVWQLRGEAGRRQVTHDGRPPRVAAIQNAGAQAVSGGSGIGASTGILLTS
jgi:acetyl-CoA acyltransferase